MSEYRDELAAARRRIEHLERDLAEKRAAQPRRSPWARPTVAALLVALLVPLVLLGTPFIPFGRGTAAVSPVAPMPPTPGLPSGHTVTWDPVFWNAPPVTDVNDDSIDDVVGLFWDSTVEEAYVVAIDGSSQEPLWQAGPLPVPWEPNRTHLDKVGPSVVLVDAAGTLRGFDLRTGAPRGEWKSELPIAEFCPFEDLSAHAYVQAMPLDNGRILDIAKGTLLPAPNQDDKLGCHGRNDLPLCKYYQGGPCIASAATLGRTLMQPYETYEDGLARVTVGWNKTEKDAPYFGVGVDLATHRVVWESRISLPADAGQERDFRYGFATGRVLLSYKTHAGPFRLVARDATSGAVSWTMLLEGTGEGSQLESLRGTRDRVYVVVDRELRIFSAGDGRPVATVSQIELR